MSLLLVIPSVICYRIIQSHQAVKFRIKSGGRWQKKRSSVRRQKPFVERGLHSENSLSDFHLMLSTFYGLFFYRENWNNDPGWWVCPAIVGLSPFIRGMQLMDSA